MKRLALLYIIFILGGQLNAKDYTVSAHKEGKVFFIKPQKINGLQVASRNLDFDISYLTSKDFVTFTATYTAHFLLHTDSLTIKMNDNEKIQLPVEFLYVVRENDKLVHRIRFDVPIEIFKEMYNDQSSYMIILSNDKYSFFYEYPLDKWNSKKLEMKEIIRIMELY